MPELFCQKHQFHQQQRHCWRSSVGAPSPVFDVFINQCDAVFSRWQPPYGKLLFALSSNQQQGSSPLQALIAPLEIMSYVF